MMRALRFGLLACCLGACILPREKIDYSSGGAGGMAGATTGTGGQRGAGGTASGAGGSTTGGGGAATGTGGKAMGAGGAAVGTGGAAGGAGGARGTGGATSGTGGTTTTDASASDAANDSPGDASDVTQASVLDQCVLLLHMNEPNGWMGKPGEVIDSSLYHHNGVAGLDVTTAFAGKFNTYGGLFRGNGYVTIPDAPQFQPVQGLTLSAWIKPSVLTGGEGGMSDAPGIITRRNDPGQSTFAVFLGIDNQVNVDIDGYNDRFNGQTKLQTGFWYHIAVVFDGNNPQADERVRLYVNGQLDTTAKESSQVFPALSADVTVGGLPAGGASFTGIMDEVAMWTRPLSDAEIAFLYTSPEEL